MHGAPPLTISSPEATATIDEVIETTEVVTAGDRAPPMETVEAGQHVATVMRTRTLPAGTTESASVRTDMEVGSQRGVGIGSGTEIVGLPGAMPDETTIDHPGGTEICSRTDVEVVVEVADDVGREATATEDLAQTSGTTDKRARVLHQRRRSPHQT